MNVKKGDTIVVLSGKDKGKQGKVLKSDPKGGKVIVEGVNVAMKHRKPRKQNEEGGIVKMETPIYACKVMLVCPKCGKPTRPPSASWTTAARPASAASAARPSEGGKTICPD